MSVRTRILIFFSLFAFVSMTAIYISGRSTQIIGQAATQVVNSDVPMNQALSDMEVSVERQSSAMYHFLLTGNKSWWDECEKQRLVYTRAFTDAQRLAAQAIEQDKLSEIDENYVQFDNQTRYVMLNPRQAATTLTLLRQGDQFLDKIKNLIDQLQDIQQGMTIVRQEQIIDTLARHKSVAFYFLATIALFFGFLALYLWRYLVRPMSLLMEGIRNFTRGKTDVQIPSIGKDELGELQEAFNEMSRELDVERKRLKSESQSDSLTGLFNMRYFRVQLVDEFSRSQRYGRPLTLLMIDVDHFKQYNDRNGHPAGDIVLKEVSRILIRNVRGTDVVARYGGEEFVVLLPETPVDAGVSVAEKIRHAVESHYFPFAGSGDANKITVSIGVSSYPDAKITSDQDLVESADKALYAAKKNGRNRVCVFSKGEPKPALEFASTHQ